MATLSIPSDPLVPLAAGTLDRLKTKRIEAMGRVVVMLQATSRGMRARIIARKTRQQRQQRLEEMANLTRGDDTEALRRAVEEAKVVGVQFAPGGKAAIAEAMSRLAQLEKAAKEKQEAAKALEGAMAGHDASALRVALEKAKACGVDGAVAARALTRLGKLEEEEARRKDEEKRLAVIAAAERETAAKQLEKERLERQVAEDKRRKEEEAAEEAQKAAAEEAAEVAEAVQKAAAEAEAERK